MGSTSLPNAHTDEQPDRGATDASDGPAGEVRLARYPSISPDGKQIVFSWWGDLWTVSSDGGHAERLTRHPGNDLRSAWSPDGRRIAFETDRTGWRNVYVMNADGTDVQRITDIDVNCELSGYYRDADGTDYVTFSASMEGDNYRSPRPYRCAVDGAGDIVRMHDAFGGRPVVSPDGK